MVKIFSYFSEKFKNLIEMNEKKEKHDKTNDVDDHITRRYDLKKRLGKGAYGIVWKATDKKSKEIVAVKKIFDAFRNQTDAQRTFREIMFLQAFRDHPNIITLRGLHKASNNKDIYLVFDYMDTDLHHVIKKGNVLKEIHRRYIMYQLFRATRYLHSGNVIHRDQKPSNILINAECRIKLADFGLARSLTNPNEEDSDGQPLLTDYVATRWYRAPEILVASKRYTKGVDMWSLGCILGEMLLGKPLFPGSSTVNQIERIMAALPDPTTQEIDAMCHGCGKGLLEGASSSKTSIQDVLRDGTTEAVDLVTKLLVFDPNKRLTATQALSHSYVQKFCNGSEICIGHNIVPPLDDDIQLSVSEYRNKLYELIANGKHAKTESPPATNNKTNKSPPSKSHLSKTTSSPPPVKHQRHSKNGAHNDEHKLVKSKVRNHSFEELREKPEASCNPVVVTRSEPISKSDTKKISASPQHRPHVPPAQVRGEWSNKIKHNITSQSKYSSNSQSYQRMRFDKISKSAEGDTLNVFPSTVSQNVYNSPQQTRIHHHERQKQVLVNQKVCKISALPKVTTKREIRTISGSPPLITSYNQKHGIVTASALHEIRSVFKH